jgi:hypothetical protein
MKNYEIEEDEIRFRFQIELGISRFERGFRRNYHLAIYQSLRKMRNKNERHQPRDVFI